DLLPHGACVLAPDWTVHAWNRILADWTGIPARQALGMNLGHRFPQLFSDRFQNRFRQVFVSGQPAVFSAAINHHFLPIPARLGPRETASGASEYASGWMAQQTNVRLLSPHPPRALVTLFDVTAETQQLSALRRERTRLARAQA